MQIEIWSDVVCPWCYIGKGRFENALQQFEGRDGVSIVHRSFQLDPTRPLAQTHNRRQMLMTKYRLSAEQVSSMDTQMEKLAADEGLEYHLGPDGVTGNTRQAHELVHLARAAGLGDALMERFYRAYFTEGRSVFDVDSLVGLAQEVGLDDTSCRRALAEGTYTAAVAAEGEQARQFGAGGVPFVVIDTRFGVSGAQAADVFLDALRRAATSGDARA
jgi:predicted DsbA family dithiol-disulfide isomerase